MRAPILVACAVAVAASAAALLTFGPGPTPTPAPAVLDNELDKVKGGIATAIAYNIVCQGITPTYDEGQLIRVLAGAAQGTGLDLSDRAAMADINQHGMVILHQVKAYSISERQAWCSNLHRVLAKYGGAM